MNKGGFLNPQKKRRTVEQGNEAATDFLPWKFDYVAFSESSEDDQDQECKETETYYKIMRKASAMRKSLFREGLLSERTVSYLWCVIESKEKAIWLHKCFYNYFPVAFRLIRKYEEILDEDPENVAVKADTVLRPLFCSYGGKKMLDELKRMRKALKKKDMESAKSAFQELKVANEKLYKKIVSYFKLVAGLGLPMTIGSLKRTREN